MAWASRMASLRSNNASTASNAALALEWGNRPCTGSHRSPPGPTMEFNGPKGLARAILGTLFSTTCPPASAQMAAMRRAPASAAARVASSITKCTEKLSSSRNPRPATAVRSPSRSPRSTPPCFATTLPSALTSAMSDSRFIRCRCNAGSNAKQASARRWRETSDMARIKSAWSAKAKLEKARPSTAGISFSVTLALMPRAPLSQVKSPVRSGP